jgi:hypothetical protein
MHVLTRMAAHCELQLKLRIRNYLQQNVYNTHLTNIFHIRKHYHVYDEVRKREMFFSLKILNHKRLKPWPIA